MITTYLGMGKMSLYRPLPAERVLLLNPGQVIDVGDRTLTAVRPPTYDAPETTGFFDPVSAALFSADSFGALLAKPAENAAHVAPDDLRDGMSTWTTVDAPWLHMTDRASFDRALDGVRVMSPDIILSGHLPPARGMTDRLLGYLSSVPDATPFVGPDQQALEEMLAGQRGE